MPIHLRMSPPNGFLVAERFRGYEQPSTGASIVVQELPAPFDKLAIGFSDEQKLASHGITLLERIELSGVGEPRLVLRAEQSLGVQVFDKWIAILGDDTESAIVTGLCRRDVSEQLLSKLYDAVLSVEQVPGDAEHTGVRLVTEGVDELQLARQCGTMSIYTLGGRFPSPCVEDPLFVVDAITAKLELAEVHKFAATRLTSIACTRNVALASTRPVTIAEMPGLELIGSAEDAGAGTPLQLYQVVLYSQTTSHMMQGVVGADRGTMWLPRFREIAASFQPNDVQTSSKRPWIDTSRPREGRFTID